MRECIYVENKEIEKYIDGKRLWLFGAGIASDKFRKLYEEKYRIVGFLDNNPKAEEKDTLPVLLPNEWLKAREQDDFVVVTSDYYGKVLGEQLKEMKLKAFDEFVVWDNMCAFHKNKNVEDFIDFNRKYWESEKISETENIVILPYEGIHDSSAIVRAYAANYLAQRHNAKLYAYIREGRKKDSITDSIWDVYESFNVVDSIEEKLSDDQMKRVDAFVEDIWPTLNTSHDWKNIEIYGINFGTTIIRHYLRVEIPTYDFRDPSRKEFLREAIGYIVFWYDYLKSHKVKAIIVEDGVSREGYMRDIACRMGIDVYVAQYEGFVKLTEGSILSRDHKYYREFWKKLSEEEQKYGIEWAKKELNNQITGKKSMVNARGDISPFVFTSDERVLEDSDRIKVLICPHIFEEDSYHCEWQLFDDYFNWLVSLGELTEKTDYDWYIKKHPAGGWRDDIIINSLLKKYPRIKKIPTYISASQLKKEGLDFALTVCGTIGYEYPALGIQVINAGDNPHIAYNFDWNPTTKKEYIDLMMNLSSIEKKIDMNEIYQYYAIRFLFSKRPYTAKMLGDAFFKNDELVDVGENKGPNKYRLFMNECSEERHIKIKENVEEIFRFIDEWKENTFYKYDIELES